MSLTVQIATEDNDRQPTPVTTLLPSTSEKPSSDHDTQLSKTPSARQRGLIVCKRFAEYTTFHGFRQIAEESEGISRRVIWTFILTISFGLLLYQMGNSIELYLSRPVTFNIKRNYFDRLQFPAITICNQNVFKITRAWEEDLYFFLERMFERKKYNVTKLSGVDKPMTMVLRKLKHRKEDLIISCAWNRIHECYPANFSDTLVKNNHCYTFNGDLFNVRESSLTGSDTGLNVLMNIEQYEFVRSRSLTAGIQVFVHHQDELPLKSISVPPGMKAFVRVSPKQVELLRSPYGVCGWRRLKYFGSYSTAKCLMECREQWLQEQCGCMSGNLPETNATAATCSLRNFSSCVLPLLADYTPTLGRCDCPTDCSYRRFNSFISFSQISTFEVDQALETLPRGTRSKMITAREVLYRVNADKRHHTINRTLVPFIRVMNFVHVNLKHLTQSVRNIEGSVKRMQKKMQHRFLFHKYMVGRVVFTVKTNWVRRWDIIRERTLQMVSFDFIPLLYTMELFEESQRDKNISTDILDRYRTMLDAKLYEKVKVSSRALQNMSTVHDIFSNKDSILIYIVTPQQYYDRDFVPSSIFSRMKKEAFYYKQVVSYLTDLNTYYSGMRRIVQASNGVNGTFDEKKFGKLKDEIAMKSRSFNYYMYLYQDRIVQRSLRMASAIEKKFLKTHAKMLASHMKLKYTLDKFLSMLEGLDRQYDKSGGVIIELAKQYINHSSSLRYNLTTLSHHIAIGEAGKALESFVSSVDSIVMYKVTLEKELWRLRQSVLSTVTLVWEKTVWRGYKRFSRDLRSLCRLKATAKRHLTVTEAELRAVRADASVSTINTMRKSVFAMVRESKAVSGACFDKMRATNADWIRRGQRAVLRSFKEKFQDLSAVKHSIVNVTGFRDEMVAQHINVKAFAAEFLKGNEISKKFVRDNFVELQIYFDDLVSVEERQSPAYTTTQLWSDFGGNIGLLLGASVLSVIEVIDFFFGESLKARKRTDYWASIRLACSRLLKRGNRTAVTES